MSSSDLAGLFFGVLAVLCAWLWWLPQRRGRDRGYLGTYQSRALPMLVRNYTTAAPFLVVASASLALVGLGPAWAGPWLAALALAMVPVAVHRSYRVPAPGVPSWLREDIDAGLVEPARPDAADRAAYWMFILLSIAGTVAALAIGVGAITGGAR